MADRFFRPLGNPTSVFDSEGYGENRTFITIDADTADRLVDLLNNLNDRAHRCECGEPTICEACEE